MDAATDLMRRMPPGSVETALNALLSRIPEHSLDLLSQVDLPLQVGPEEEGVAHYCLNSTVMLSLATDNKQSRTFNLSGSIRGQMTMTLAVADGHLVNMGKMIKEMEGKLRNSPD